MQADLMIFGATVLAFFVIGVPIIARTVSLPEEFSFEDVPDHELNPVQRAYFEALDRQLKALAYVPQKTFKVTNLPNPNINRAYASVVDSGRCCAMCISSADPKIANTVNSVEFNHEFADGTVVITRNGGISDPFKPMPERLVKVYPGLHDVALLKKKHDQRVRNIKAASMQRIEAAQLYDRINEHHRRFCQFQLSAGMLRHAPEQKRYFASKLCALAGVGNFLNPFADNFTFPRALAAVLTAVCLPLAGFGSGVITLDGSPEMLHPAWTISLYLFSGAALGFIFTSKAFIWGFIVGYLPLSILGAGADSYALLSVAMGYVAHKVASWRLKRQYVASAD